MVHSHYAPARRPDRHAHGDLLALRSLCAIALVREVALVAPRATAAGAVAAAVAANGLRAMLSQVEPHDR